MENNQSIEKKSIWQKELNTKEIMICIGIFATIIAYIFVFIYPQYTNYKSYISDLEEVEEQIQDFESKISDLPQLESQLSGLKEEIEEKSKILSNDMEDGMFLVGLSNLMRKLDVKMVGYTVEDTILFDSFYAIPTSIEVRGDYNNIRKIMEYLEKQENITQILDYNMETYIEETEKTQETEEENIVTESSEPKAEGLIVAKFKFIMYSSNNTTSKLENDDDRTWNPGKYNPFTTTTR